MAGVLAVMLGMRVDIGAQLRCVVEVARATVNRTDAETTPLVHHWPSARTPFLSSVDHLLSFIIAQGKRVPPPFWRVALVRSRRFFVTPHSVTYKLQ
jgi:hypothetical protein